MNIKTNLLEEYVSFVDNTKKRKKYFEINIILFVVIISTFLFYLNIIQSRIRIIIQNTIC